MPSEDTPIEVTEVISNREAHLLMLKQRPEPAQNRMKLQTDKKRFDPQFSMGDQVLLRLQPYTQSSIASRPYPKLSYKFFGPYKVIERVGAIAYRLSCHLTVKFIRSFTSPSSNPFFRITLQFTLTFLALNVVPELILQRRLVRKGNTAVPHVFIKWSGLSPASATWEDYNVLNARFPLAPAWGQVDSSGGGVVTTQG